MVVLQSTSGGGPDVAGLCGESVSLGRRLGAHICRCPSSRWRRRCSLHSVLRPSACLPPSACPPPSPPALARTHPPPLSAARCLLPACLPCLQPAKKWEAVLTEMKFGPGPTPEATADKAAVTTPTQKLDLAGALA